MQIIRKRKGFSTNSSSASEWVPPGATVTNSGTSPAPGNSAPLLTLPQLRATAQQPAAAPGWFNRDSPLLKIGFLGLLLLCLFILEEVIRRIVKKIGKARHEE